MAILLAALLLSAQPQTLEDYISGWWIVSGDARYVTFALRRSIEGPASSRQIVGRTIGKNTENGIKETEYTMVINCAARTSRYLRLKAVGLNNLNLGDLPLPSKAARPIIKGSTGDILAQFACEKDAKGEPAVGYMTMLPTPEVADQFFRLLGIGLEREAASVIAVADARRAPKAFNDLLNVFVPAERQLLVRAIKTPEATAE